MPQPQLTQHQRSVLQRDEQLRQAEAIIRALQAKGELPPDPREAVEMYARMAKQAMAERELLAYMTQLRPEHVEHLARLDATGGGPAVVSALMATGLSRGALEVAAATYDAAGGFQGAVRVVQAELEKVAEENRAAFVEQAVERHAVQEGDAPSVRALKERSGLVQLGADPKVQRHALDLLGELGVQVPEGMSPLEALHTWWEAAGRIAGERQPFEKGLSTDAALELAAKRTGRPVGEVREMFDLMGEHDLHHGLHERQVASDYAPAAVARRKAMEPSQAVKQRVAREESRREKLERFYDSRDVGPTKPAQAAAKAVSQATQGRQDVARDVKGRPDASAEARHVSLSEAYDALDRAEPEKGEEAVA